MRITFGVVVLLAVLACASAGWAQGVSSLSITEFMASNSATLADGDGDYSDWVEIHNSSASAVALAGCYLTDSASNLTKWVFPASAGISVPANGYLVVFASGKGSAASPYVDGSGYIHTSFSLAADGESIALISTDGTTIVSAYWDYPQQGADVSYGLGANAVTGYFKTPTPGAANGNSGNGWVADTKFSVKRGFYTSPFTVEVTCSTTSATIKYTLDCTTPSETNGTVYTGPITISGTTILRVMAYKTDWFSTDVDTQTYLFLSDIVTQSATKPNANWPDSYTPTGGGGGGGSSKQAINYGMDSRVTGDSRYASLIDDAFLAIPTVSIVTDLPNLFDTSSGIYANPESDLECPACMELINPDGSDGFHVNTGLKIRGGTSASKSNPKHSFRVVMRTEYGDDKIEYPMFGDAGAKKFDKMDLRTAQNFSWHLTSPQYATWLDDPFTRDTLRDMGQPYTRGFFFHLYLDGIYWGLYQTEERPEAYFAQSYLGGDKDDYDALKSDDSTGVMYATDGTTTLYYNYWTQVKAGVSTAADYFRLQGMNTDGTTNSAYVRYLDADNLIDYMLVVFFTAGLDMPLGPPGSNSKPRNLYVVGNNVLPDGFKYLAHDNEWSLMQQYGVSYDRVNVTLGSTLGNQTLFNPWWLHLQLKANAEYLIRFADRVHKHFFLDGALTSAKCVARYQQRIDEINLAVIAESARWGDYLSSSDPRTRDDDWLPAVQWVRDSYLAASPQTRTDVVLAQLRTAGLYPSIDAPEFSQYGGTVDAGFSLAITAASGTIYYTTDGTDPRLVGGNPSATAQSGASGLTTSLSASTTVKARAWSGSVWSALTESAFTVRGTIQPGTKARPPFLAIF